MVITSPSEVGDEARLISTLLQEGAWKVHLRKPGEPKKIFTLLENIDSALHARLVIHGLPEDYPGYSTRFHVPATYRSIPGHSISIHHIRETGTFPGAAYYLLGPVFKSHSKEGYGPGEPGSVEMLRASAKKNRIIALGGIDPVNIKRLDRKVYVGAAVLGWIWQHHDPLQAFRELKAASLQP